MRPWFITVHETDTSGLSLDVTKEVTGGRGHLFGGVLVGAAAELLEASHPGRQVVWLTCQFAAPAHNGDRIDLAATVHAEGRSIVQAAVAGSIGDAPHSTVLGALGSKNFDDVVEPRPMPDVPGPAACEPLDFDPGEGGLNARIDARAVDGFGPPRRRSRYWMRFDRSTAGNVYSLAIAADFFPPSLSAAVGRRVFGASLDNSLRLLGRSDCEWLLAEMTVDGLQNGIAHGTTHLWSSDGDLLAIGSQTCAVSEFG